jgi:hypothetical protein
MGSGRVMTIGAVMRLVVVLALEDSPRDGLAAV